jgi:phosphatidylserine/phosphatidylglycerophosphate/cardiolipin synthase-like enzyme
VNIVRNAGRAWYGTLLDAGVHVVLDPTIGREMDEIFQEDLRHAEEITLTTFQQRSWWARFTERAANVVMRLL